MAQDEKVFTMIRSKTLTLPLIHKEVQEYLDHQLDYQQKNFEPIDSEFEYEMVSDWILNDRDDIQKQMTLLDFEKATSVLERAAHSLGINLNSVVSAHTAV
jgi:hypothetical protein